MCGCVAVDQSSVTVLKPVEPAGVVDASLAAASVRLIFPVLGLSLEITAFSNF